VRAALVMVFTDLVGSTALGQAIKDRPMTEAKLAHFAKSGELSALHRGRTIKNTGDGVLAVFRTVNDALAYARAFQQQPGSRQLDDRVRAAVHHGFVDVTEDDVFGDEVNCAGRIIGANKGAEIWLSEPARHEIDKAGVPVGCAFVDIVGIELKDFPAQRLHKVVPAAADPRWPVPPVEQLPARPAPIALGGFDEASEEPLDIAAVDFLSGYEVWIDRPREGRQRTISARIDLHRQMYFETEHGARVLFGFKRLFVETSKSGPGTLSVPEDVRRGVSQPRAVQVNPDDGAGSKVTLCVSGDRGGALGMRALPRIGEDNFLSELALATAEVRADRVRVELRVPLKPEGIVLDRTIEPLVSQENRDDIAAIAAILVRKKHRVSETGHLRRGLKVRERGSGE